MAALFRFDLQGFVGMILIVAAWQLLSNSISVLPACDWSQETRSTCQTNQTQIVELEYCLEPHQGQLNMLSATQLGLGTNWQTSMSCQQNGCKGGCMKITTPCEGGHPVQADIKYVCEKASVSRDVRVLAVFVYPPFLVLGLLLLMLNRDFSAPQLAAILIIGFGVLSAERAINIVRGCNWNEEMVDVTNSLLVTLNLCESVKEFILIANSPFATNVRNDDECLLQGCSTSQCLRTTINKEVTDYHCSPQRAEASAAPVDLFFAIGIILFGFIVLFVGRKADGEHQPLLDYPKE